MRRTIAAWIGTIACACLAAATPGADPVAEGSWRIDNGMVRLSVEVKGGRLAGETLERLDGSGLKLASDGGFSLEFAWTDWRAPNKLQNAENPEVLGPADFIFARAEEISEGGVRELRLHFHGDEKVYNPLRLALVYRLEPGRSWVRRRLEVSDPGGPLHFLRSLCPLDLRLKGGLTVVKGGGFGQPVAVAGEGGGAFFALEYPAADNQLLAGLNCRRPPGVPNGRRPHQGIGGLEGTDGPELRCGQEIGERVGPAAIASDWAVEALTPDGRLKHWFFEYLDAVRVAPLRPYTLYNSWYDLRSPVYPKITADHVMNEANVRRIIGLLRANMVEKHGIRLDAFVLDDGWDVYGSDWELRRDMFPSGLRPVADELAATGTRLGVWFGPSGGYSFRKERLAWMTARGYEAVGDQLCLAGAKYQALFKKRALEFVNRDRVGYFKWDGIQFSCSQADHGHAVDLYSRRAVMETVAGLCREARAADPGVFLNVTSGTWLSPWWLRFADQIWMGGEDYGWSDVPSLSRRDAAITYRDSVLYDDFRVQDLWFPLANLMTHGIIKGRLQMLGGEDEPLDKFTDETVMYAARGVSMFELYVSPDLLSDGEWAAIAGALRWARDRFGLLRRSEMVGGDPRKGEPYGYVHADGQRAIVVARNPLIEPQVLRVRLASELGLDASAGGLALERIYPTRFIEPRLRAAGEDLEIALSGFETAVFEMYPAAGAGRPLPAGVEFSGRVNGDGSYTARCYGAAAPPMLLEPWPGSSTVAQASPAAAPDSGFAAARLLPSGGRTVEFKIDVPSSVRGPQLAVRLTPDPGSIGAGLPAARVLVDGIEAKARINSEANAWSWVAIDLPPGKHRLKLTLKAAVPGKPWRGKAAAWLSGRVTSPFVEVTWKGGRAAQEPPLLPLPWPDGESRRQLRIGEATIVVR